MPDKPEIIGVGENSVTIKWKSKFNGGYNQIFTTKIESASGTKFISDIPNAKDGYVQVKIEDLAAGTEHSISVMSTNLGQNGPNTSQYSPPILVKTANAKGKIKKTSLKKLLKYHVIIITCGNTRNHQNITHHFCLFLTYYL